jgi:exopolysaccharide production protein ExoZ
MFFYFIFGLCLLFRTRSMRLIALSLIIVALIAGGIATTPASAIGKLYTNPIIAEFLAGVLIGAIFNRLQPSIHSRTAGITLLVLAFALLTLAHAMSLPRIVGFGLPAVLSVVGALFLDQPTQRRDVRIGALLGDRSYSIYLAHPFVLRPFFLAATILIPAPTPWVQLALVVGATIAGVIGGMGCYYLIETPLNSLARRLLSPADVSPRRSDHSKKMNS